MGDNTGIEWTEATWNPVVGCTHVSAGCDHCYAARETSGRLSRNPTYAGLAVRGRFTGEVRLLPERLEQPLRWRRPRRVFVNSMSDLFHDSVPDEYIAQVFGVMAAAPRHTFQVLTKRPGRMASLLSQPWRGHREEDTFPRVVAEYWQHYDGEAGGGMPWPLPNVWLGTSVEDQKWANVRVPKLLEAPAAVRFLSCEPLLGPVDLTPYLRHQCDCDMAAAAAGHPWDGMHYRQSEYGPRVDWVIAGGESGPDARPMHPGWVRSLRDQCVAAGVAFFFKQWGEYLPVPVEDDPKFSGGRAFNHPRGGRASATIRERGTRAFSSGETRPMRPGDRNGFGEMLDDDTLAVRVGKKAAGRLLDGMGWAQYPEPRVPV